MGRRTSSSSSSSSSSSTTTRATTRAAKTLASSSSCCPSRNPNPNGYGGDGPWQFSGRAIYQLQLVRVENARRFVPRELQKAIVAAFGWTLGGVYLARYADSPVGAFDELVVLAGLIWDKPTSAAWAGRVYVNNQSAMRHGIHAMGLPSMKADFRFQKSRLARKREKRGGLPRATADGDGDGIELRRDSTANSLHVHSRSCSTSYEIASSGDIASRSGFGPRGPRISLSLPSFSGGTRRRPEILRYVLKLGANIGLAPKLSLRVHQRGGREHNNGDCSDGVSNSTRAGRRASNAGGCRAQPMIGARGTCGEPQILDELLSGPCLVALKFDAMEFMVSKPVDRRTWRDRGAESLGRASP